MPPQHREWRTLIGEAQSGNEFARERLIMMYLRTMLKQAYDYANTYYCEFEDCFQNAVIGLICAVKKYDATSPDSFVSYFPLWARQVMNRDCLIKGSLFRFPVHYKEQFMPILNGLNDTEIGPDNIATTDIAVIDKYGQCGDYSGIYNELEEIFSSIYKERYEEIVDGKFNYNHLVPYLPLFDGAVYQDGFEEDILMSERNKILRNVVDNCLREREREVIVMRYGLDDGRTKTLEEVGGCLGVTRERIRQIESKALKKLQVQCRKLR